MVYEHSQLLDYWIWTQQFPVPFCEAHIQKCSFSFTCDRFKPELQVFCVARFLFITTGANCWATMMPSVLSEVISIHSDCALPLQLSPTTTVISVDITLFQTEVQCLFTYGPAVPWKLKIHWVKCMFIW